MPNDPIFVSAPCRRRMQLAPECTGPCCPFTNQQALCGPPPALARAGRAQVWRLTRPRGNVRAPQYGRDSTELFRPHTSGSLRLSLSTFERRELRHVARTGDGSERPRDESRVAGLK